MKRILLGLGLLLAAALAFALPTVDEVQAQVKAGHYAQAESMMQEVVAAKPKSAKAHYVYAELLAHNGHLDEAARQARLARDADPALGFTDPAKFRSFEQLLMQRQQARASHDSTLVQPSTAAPAKPGVVPAPIPARDTGLPGWVWILGLALAAWLLWRLLARRRPAASAYGAGVPGLGGAYRGTGMPVAPGGGSGLLGTGIAAAGGFAAGMLAEKMLDGQSAHAAEGTRVASSQDGLQPGMFDDYGSPAADLDQRSIDFGSGGDWGSDGGGGADMGGGGDGW